MKVLVVDDEQPIVQSVAYSLSKEGYKALTASDAEEGLHTLRTEQPDLVILDVMLPAASGFDLCRLIRKDSKVPIIMLTARADETDRVVGLELGADDYVTKPFSMRELMARVKSVLRRSFTDETSTRRPVQVGVLKIDPSFYEVNVNDKPVELSPKEFQLLYFLASNPDQVFTRRVLLDRVWGEANYVEERTVDVHMHGLREKIEANPARPQMLLTVRGVGYRFRSA